METFRWIPGYEGLYDVSDMGRVRSYKGELKFLKQGSNCGYFHVILYKNNKKKKFGVHQLVAMAFLGHVPDGRKLVPDHIDKNKSNNRVENLRIVTQRENCSRRERDLPTGVYWVKKRGNYKTQIQINGKLITKCGFNTAEEASAAYQKALSEINAGKKEKINT
jgi:hypothetical protein